MVTTTEIELIVGLETWLEMECYPPSNGEYHEDGLSAARVDVATAYRLKLIEMGVELAVDWCWPEEEYPPVRQLASIEKLDNPDGYRVTTTKGYTYGCYPNKDVMIVASTPTEKVLWGLYLEKSRKLFDLENPEAD